MKPIVLSRRAVLGAALGATLPLPARAEQPTTVTVAMPTHPEVLEPVLANNIPKLRTLPNLFDCLLGFDMRNNMAIRAGLAERWRQIDARTIELDLRPGVVFHDGSPMTVDDVLFSLGPVRGRGPGGAGQTVTSQFTSTFEKVEASGPNQVRVTTRAPDPLIEQRLAGWTAEIVSRRAFEAVGNWDRWAQAPVGAGPYRVVESRTDVGLRLKRHEAYWGAKGLYENVDFRIVPELSTRMAGLKTGAFDIIVDVGPDLISEVERDPRFVVVGGSIPNPRVVNFDIGAPVLADVRIRRALALAVDRDLIVSALWSGRTDVPNGFQSPTFGAMYLADFPKPRFDPTAARALLKEAGYAGAPIAYRVMANYYALEVQTAQVLVEMWADVGLNVKIESVEGLSQAQKTPINAMWNNSTAMFYPDPLSMALRTHGPSGPFQRSLTRWANPEFNKIAAEIGVTTDLAERRRMHRRALEIVEFEDPPCILLHNNAMLYGMRRDLAWRPNSGIAIDFRGA